MPLSDHWPIPRLAHYHTRLLIGVELVKLSRVELLMQLDTGARMPELFPAAAASLSSHPGASFIPIAGGANESTIHSNITLKIGSTMVHGLDEVQSRRAVAFDAAGLLPAAIFHRIYISHSGGFVVINPASR